MQSEMFGLGVKNELVVSSHLMNLLFSQTQVKIVMESCEQVFVGRTEWKAGCRGYLGL